MRNPTITPQDIQLLRPYRTRLVRLPLFASPVECGRSTTGFSSPADDYIEQHLDLNDFHRIKQNTTFLIRAISESMADVGINEKDILIVDTRQIYRERDIVICCLNGSYKAKMLERIEGKLYLVSRNPAYEPIEVREADDLRIFGVVCGLSRSFRHR